MQRDRPFSEGRGDTAKDICISDLMTDCLNEDCLGESIATASQMNQISGLRLVHII